MLVFPSLLLAGFPALPDQPVFGPKLYERTDASSQFTDTFAAPLPGGAIGPPFLLHVLNGDSGGRHRVAWAKITLNGERVVGRRDFTRRWGYDRDRDDDDDRDEWNRDSKSQRVIIRRVSLLPMNTLELTLKGAPGSILKVSVLGTKIPPTPASLTPNPLSLTIGATGTLTATLAPVPSKPGFLLVKSSDERVAQVREFVRFERGQSRVNVPVKALGEGTAHVKVKLNRGRATSTVVVSPPPPTVTSLLPDRLTITQGGSGALTVTLNAVQSTDTVVALSSSAPGVVSVGPNVTVPAGRTSAEIPVSGNTPGSADITASLNDSHATSMVTVTPGLPSIVSLLPPSSTVLLGATTSLAVTISAAQSTPTEIALSAEPVGIVTVPPTVVVPAGRTSAEITVGTVALGTALVRANLNGTTAEAAVHVTAPPPALTALRPTESSLAAGATETLTVKINAAQPTNTEIKIAVDHPAVLRVPESVTVPAGQTEAGFTVTGLTVGDSVVTATLVTDGHGTTVQQAVVHVTPPLPAIVTLGPSPLKLQQGATGELTVTLNAAQLTDTKITLTTDLPDVIMIADSVAVPAGQTQAGFPVKGLQVGTAIVTATLAGSTISTAQATVEVTAPPTVVTGLTPASLSLPKGTPGVLRVTVSPAPAEATPVDLSSSDPGVAGVPTTVTIPAGALFADFPVLSIAEGSATITASLNGASAQAQITVTPAELVSLTIAPVTPTAFTGETVPFTATGTFTDGTTQDVTTQVTWTSSDDTVASIGPDGVAVAKAAGTTTITAASGAISADTVLTVLTLPALVLTPQAFELPINNNIFMIVSSSQVEPVDLTVTLAAAGTGSVSVPDTAVIPAGQSSTTFLLMAVSSGTVTLTATAPGHTPATALITIP